MARRRAALTSCAALGSKASDTFSATRLVASGSLQEGQRLAKPGLSGLSSNSSWQITQVRIGNGIDKYFSEKAVGMKQGGQFFAS